MNPVPTSYYHPAYVNMVAKGLRKTGRFNPVKHWILPGGWLYFEDANGDLMVFAPFTPRLVPAYVPGDELIDE